MNVSVDNNEIMRDKFLSEYLKRDVYRINVKNTLSEENENILKELRGSDVFLYCKALTDDTETIMYLSGFDFKIVETNITLQKDIDRAAQYDYTATIRLATPEDEEAAVELARNNFQYSRFHVDPNIANANADMVKAEWVRNFFKGTRGNHMLVATVDDEIKGFCQLIQQLDTLTIDLIAVDKSARKQRVATDMVNYAEQHLNDLSVKYRVGTQITNTPSLGLYQRLGFKVVNKQYVFHYHK